MIDRRSSRDDLTRTWQESIAVKITAAVVYAIVLIACVVTAFSLRGIEQRLVHEYDDKADRLAYDIVVELQRRPAVSDDDVAERLSRKLGRFGFSAAMIIHGDRTIQIGNPEQNAGALERLIPVVRDDAGESSRTLRVTLYHVPLHGEVSSRRKTTFLITGAAALVFGFLLAWAINKFITGPIRTLVNATRAVTDGDLAIRLEPGQADEFGILSRFFNRMLDRIEQELTERRQAEALLRRSEEELGHILDSIHAGVILINIGGHEIVYVNSFAAAMIGLPKDKILGRICLNFVCPAEQGRCPIIDQEIVNNAERVLLRGNGKPLPILKSVGLVPYHGEEHIIESFIDISDINAIKKAERELRDANDEIQAFVYSASHDMRQPLVNIKGYSAELGRSLQEIQMILRRYADRIPVEDRERIRAIMSDDVRSSSEYIGLSVDRMSSLMDALLKLFHLGSRVFKPEPIDMQVMVRTVLDSLADQVRERRIMMTVEDMPDLVADRVSMAQIMSTLLDNAVKYIVYGRPATVVVSGERVHGEAIFHVRDNGRGMSQEDIPKAFDIFKRVGKQDVPGEGMGLAYTKTLVRRYGGRIWCESELGVGTTFSFAIPISAPLHE